MLVEIRKLPYFDRRGGVDHVFPFVTSRGPLLIKDWRTVRRCACARCVRVTDSHHQFLSNSLLLVPLEFSVLTEGSRYLVFNRTRDIVVPGFVSESVELRAYGEMYEALNATQRSTRAYFRGQANNALRRALLAFVGSDALVVREDAQFAPHTHDHRLQLVSALFVFGFVIV
jgi:hypothetical protein